MATLDMIPDTCRFDRHTGELVFEEGGTTVRIAVGTNRAKAMKAAYDEAQTIPVFLAQRRPA